MNDILTDPRLKEGDDDLQILFAGSKTFWRFGAHLDILIVLHKLFDCVEVLSYHHKLCKQSPRIYLNYRALVDRIDNEILEFKVKAKQEEYIRRHKDYNLEDIYQTIAHSMICNYIFSRLDYMENPESNLEPYNLAYQSYESIKESNDIDSDDELTPRKDVLTDKPDILIPVECRTLVSTR